MRESIGHYRILDRMGGSAMGEVYRARDTRAGRTVAVRVLSDEIARDPDRRRRFIADARAASAVSHPNIAALYEVGEEPDLLYLVSEFVPGETLRSVMGGRAINPRRAIDLAAQVADAIAEAHARGMVHGDLRPETIVVTPKGSAKIMEPGFPAWLGEAPGPDGASGSDRTDVAALGALLREMLAGLDLSPEINRIVRRMSGHDADAFGSAAVAASELRSLSASLAARSLTVDPPPVPAAQPRRFGVRWIAGVVIVAALAALIWLATRS
jgi:serine/threonine protein kinase